MAASYPTSVKSFTTKTDSVDDVMASHVNDLQDEVVAVETALGAGLANPVVQIVNTTTGATSTGTTTIPNDDTIPQNSEGDEYMTLAITPKSAINKLKIEIVFNVSNSSANEYQVVALFQDSTANALACVQQQAGPSAALQTISFTHYMTAGTTSATTFKIRSGAASGTTRFNGADGGRKFGGVLSSSITITEFKA